MKQKQNSTKPSQTEAEKKQVKRDNFKRVCPPRMDKAIRAIGLVGDCTLPTYLYSDKDAQSVCEALQVAVDVVKSRFAGEPGKSGGFVLPS